MSANQVGADRLIYADFEGLGIEIEKPPGIIAPVIAISCCTLKGVLLKFESSYVDGNPLWVTLGVTSAGIVRSDDSSVSSDLNYEVLVELASNPGVLNVEPTTDVAVINTMPFGRSQGPGVFALMKKGVTPMQPDAIAYYVRLTTEGNLSGDFNIGMNISDGIIGGGRSASRLILLNSRPNSF